MQRHATLLLLSLLSGLVVTGCPEKTVEKEAPAPAPKALKEPSTLDKSGADEKAAGEDEHGEDQDDRAEEPNDKRAPKKKRADKAGPDKPADKDQGGW